MLSMRYLKCWSTYQKIFFQNDEVVDVQMLYIIPDIVAAAVLSGNRNFEGRVHPLTRANYLASPPLVVAYALAGTVCCCFYSSKCTWVSISLNWGQ